MTIVFEKVSKSYRVRNTFKFVANSISVNIDPSASIALLGKNGAGKSTLLRMISGEIKPDSGRIISQHKISWPVGFAGSFHKDLTGLQNTRFIARVYGVDTYSLEKFVQEFSELGDHFYMPFRSYSSGMRSRLAFGVSMGIDFDTYLIDEVTSVGDASFRQKSSALLKKRIETSGAIIVSHSLGILKELCTISAVLENGKLIVFDTVDEGVQYYNETNGVVDKNLNTQNEKIQLIKDKLNASREAVKKLNERNTQLKVKLENARKQ